MRNGNSEQLSQCYNVLYIRRYNASSLVHLVMRKLRTNRNSAISYTMTHHGLYMYWNFIRVRPQKSACWNTIFKLLAIFTMVYTVWKSERKNDAGSNSFSYFFYFDLLLAVCFLRGKSYYRWNLGKFPHVCKSLFNIAMRLICRCVHITCFRKAVLVVLPLVVEWPMVVGLVAVTATSPAARTWSVGLLTLLLITLRCNYRQ